MVSDVPIQRMVVAWMAVGLLLTSLSTCRRDTYEAPETPRIGAAPKLPDLLDFPDTRRVDDEAVNSFVERALTECASGDYDRFRLLWSAKGDPLSRDEYDQGWQAVTKIAVRALEKVLLADDAPAADSPDKFVYVLLADVSLDPNHRAGKRRPNREVVLMLVHEQDAWRLADPPKSLRTWIKGRKPRQAGRPSGGNAASEPENRPVLP